MGLRVTSPRLLAANAVLAILLCAGDSASAQEKKDVPRITAITPISVAPGARVTFKIRGVKLDAASEARFPAWPALKAELKEKKKAALPNGVEAKDFGDTECEATVTLPADLPAGTLAIEVISPDGSSEPNEIAVRDGAAASDEKEPNNGFAEAQAIELGNVVRGRVKEDRDVDVFLVQVETGQTLSIEITAARRSSLLDPLVSIFDEKRRLLRVMDDAATRDPALVFTPPAPGKYFVVVQDAGDRGGSWHNYELLVQPQP